jgi:hypothetical protein
MESFDINALSPEEFSQLEEWKLKLALQMCAGYMAVAQSQMRETSEAFHKHLSAKEEFSRYRQLSSILQTIIRTSA